MQRAVIKNIQKILLGIIALVLVVMMMLAQQDDRHVVVDAIAKEKVVYINDAKMHVAIADTPLARAQGLGGVVELAYDQGMLFVFDRADEYSFWMKDMLIPIDIVWLDEHWDIIDVHTDVQPESYPEMFTPREPAIYVLETNTGFVQEQGIAIGDRASLTE